MQNEILELNFFRQEDIRFDDVNYVFLRVFLTEYFLVFFWYFLIL